MYYGIVAVSVVMFGFQWWRDRCIHRYLGFCIGKAEAKGDNIGRFGVRGNNVAGPSPINVNVNNPFVYALLKRLTFGVNILLRF